MNELNIAFDLQSPQEKDKKINIYIEKKPDKRLLYKFIVGNHGTWETLKDFSEEDSTQWFPEKEGNYVIMVQAKESSSSKSFDYVSKVDYVIGQEENRLIKGVYLDKTNLTIGDKLNLTVEANSGPVVYRYWAKENEDWELIKDYSADSNLIWKVMKPGQHEIMVECKTLESKNNFDDSQKVKYRVSDTEKLEITDFKALVSDMIVDNELIFQVEAAHADSRTRLYKFIKINSDGTTSVIQDYSNKKMVSFVETQAGEYKLLCFAKDMHSKLSYDDRALLNYKIKPYKDIAIKSFAADLNSPQVCETAVTFKAVVSGGRELQYRFIVDGNYTEDTGYTRNSTFVWNTKKPGEYKIQLFVKDVSFEGTHEASSDIDFKIEEKCSDPVVINEVVLDKSNKVLKGEVVNIKVIAKGGTDLRYSFIEKKDGKDPKKIDYGTCNWVNFSSSEKGSYELEVRVKDKYSKREFDSHSFVNIEVYDYIPASIDHVLYPAKENYLVGDTLTYTVITQNTKQTLLSYVLNINGQKVEETDFVSDKKYVFTPKCSGSYSLEIYAKNEKSDKEFDTKKEIRLKVYDAPPVTNTRIQCDKVNPSVNEQITFTATSSGGKDVLYQFYIMNMGEWTLVQDYSKKNYHSFIPFSKGSYRILALSRSNSKKSTYEDYDILDINVE